MKRTLHSLSLASALCLVPFFAQSQSTMEFQSGTHIEVTAGADICADNIIINGTHSGTGTQCGVTLSVERMGVATPTEFRLEQNFPNPFNPTTKILFDVGFETYVSLKLFDLLGKEVVVLVDGQLAAGTYEVSLDAQHLSSGVYYYRLQAGNFTQTRKLSLVR